MMLGGHQQELPLN